MLYVITDTHGAELPAVPAGATLLHLGDWEHGARAPAGAAILVRGNHDGASGPLGSFDLVCDGVIIGEVLYTHEPVERLPRGCVWNVHGHLHDDRYEEYGYQRRPFHFRLEPARLYRESEIRELMLGAGGA